MPLIAACASASLDISTKPKPFERPVSRSIITLAEVTVPNCANAACSDSSRTDRPGCRRTACFPWGSPFSIQTIHVELQPSVNHQAKAPLQTRAVGTEVPVGIISITPNARHRCGLGQTRKRQSASFSCNSATPMWCRRRTLHAERRPSMPNTPADAPQFDYIVVGAGTAGCLLANRLSRRPAQPRAAARGRRPRRLPLDPHPGRLPLLHRQPAHRLAVPHRARAGAERARAALSARQGAGRLLEHQRHDLHARPGARLRRLGAAVGDDGWRWRRVPALFQAPRGPLARRRRVARRVGFDRRGAAPAASGASSASGCAGRPRRLRRGRAAGRHPGAPPTSTAATTRASATSRSTSAAACAGTRPRRSCGPCGTGRNLQVLTGAQVDAPAARRRRRGALACAGVEVQRARRRAAAVRRRARWCWPPARSARRSCCSSRASGRGAAARARHRAACTSARRRREPAGPPADPRGVQGARRAHAEHAGQLLARQGADRLEYLLTRSGPMSMAPSQLGAFTRSSRRARTGRTSSTTCSRCRSTPSASRCIASDAFTASVCNLSPTSRGHVRIRSPDPTTRRRSAPNYLSTAEDRRVAADSLRLTRRIVGMPALARYAPREIHARAPQYQSDDELARLAGDIGTTIFHPVGTCRMGRADDPMAVVDARLRVRGIARAARGRRQRDADHHQRQHQLADADDRRARGRVDACGHTLNQGSARAAG